MPRISLGVLTALCLIAPEVHANGRAPSSVNVHFQPSDKKRIVLPVTFGLLLSDDDGATFRWVCEEAIGYGGTFDPDYAVTENGWIYATTFDGLQYTSDGGCTFQLTAFYGDPTGGSAEELLSNIWIGEVEVASDGRIWAATSTGGKSNDIYLSNDGATFRSANNWHERAWWVSLKVAPSSAETVYVSGFLPPEYDPDTGEELSPAQTLLTKTTNAGTSWTPLPVDDFVFGEAAKKDLYIEGVSSSDPNLVYARIRGVRTPAGDDLYRSTDGGQSFAKVLEMNDTITAFAVTSSGRVFAGTTTPCIEDIPSDPTKPLPNKGCVRTSPTGAAGTWVAPATEPKLGCIRERASDTKLFGCANNWEPDNFALGTSNNNGDSWSSVLRFADIAGPLDCPASSLQNECAEERWPGVCVSLGICTDGDGGPIGSDGGPSNDDGGLANGDGGNNSAGSDAGTKDKEPKGGCLSCQTSNGGQSAPLLFFFALILVVWRIRRHPV